MSEFFHHKSLVVLRTAAGSGVRPPAPNTLFTPEQLATQFVVREPRR